MIYTPAAERALSLLKTPTARDRQTVAGVSDLVNGCDRCVAKALRTPREPSRTAPLAALLGTAFHALAERRIKRDPSGLATEVKVTAGTVGGIAVRGTADLVDLENGEVLDWKVLAKRKIKAFRTAYAVTEDGAFFDDDFIGAQLMAYYLQVQVYAAAVNDRCPDTIHTASLLLVPRDATRETVDDIVQIEFPFDPEVRSTVMARAQDLLDYEGGLDDLRSSPYCWTCNNSVRIQDKNTNEEEGESWGSRTS